MRLSAVLLPMLAACSEYDPQLIQVEDRWMQAPNNEVDILFVVDDSTSMLQEQALLAAGFDSFAVRLEDAGMDFHLGVLTTTVDYGNDGQRGELIGNPPFLTADDDIRTEFAARAQVGVSGSDQEKGLEAAHWAIGLSYTESANLGFLRTSAHLLTVIVSDEDDCSDRGALLGRPARDCYDHQELLTPVSEILEDLWGLKERWDQVQIAAIVGVDQACGAYPAKRYALAANATGGWVGDICASDWSEIMDELGLQGTGIRTTFPLTQPARPDSLAVYVDGDQVRLGWSYDTARWQIVFDADAIPPRGSEVRATYFRDLQAPDRQP